MVTRTQETQDQAIRRLAQQAREKGVRLVRDAKDGRHYASSVSHPGTWHYVTGISCDCQGFVGHGRCMHHAALMAALGWLEDPKPEPHPIECETCRGVGSHPATIQVGRSWRYDNVTCEDCHGSGIVQPHTVPAA